ncbi:adhesion G-protein coupled receptor G6-like [Labrus mixtus]|uniref:adhesion G-protein coupled receptor G6-like n=1 Tax=Labrus mixtus TaxID=508554 RepID=UPI0029C027D0|nr:adhesion G-protein coupled receptor G6-like [Labrus mixtus]
MSRVLVRPGANALRNALKNAFISSASAAAAGSSQKPEQFFVEVYKLTLLPSPSALGCSSASCNVVLTDAHGEFTSPCYPLKYPNSQACKWTLQAPAGFIIQLSFLDFDLEEAPGCIYDRVVVNTGNVDVRFCGPTANGLTLNSTGNVMELSFTSDFSVQKRGFSVSFRHVAVALRNQKVTISGGNGQVTEVTESVSIPALSHLTLCFELERSAQKQKEWIFTYTDSSSNVALSLGADQSGVQMIVDGVVCPIDSILPAAEFTFSRKAFCVLWTSSNGRVGVYYNGNYWAKTCSSSSGHSVPGGGNFRLGGQHSFSGNIYNLRLWDHAMSVQQLNALTCDIVGNVVDWDNSHWTIPSTLAQTDTSLSCICYPHCIHLTTAAPTSGVSPPSDTPLTTSCDSPGLGCPASSPATSSTDSTNTIHATNANSDVLPPITPSSSTIPTTSMPLTPTMSPTTATSSSSSTASSFSSSSVMPATTITITTSAATPSSSATNVASASSTPHAQQTTSSTPTVSSATTNLPATNPTTHVPGTSPPLLLVATNQPATNIAVTAASSREELFYRISFVVDDGDSELTLADVDRAVALWLNQTFLNWTHAVYIDSSSVQPAVQSGGNPTSYACQALLVYYYISNQSLGEAAVSARMSGSEGLMGAGLQVQPGSTNVRSVENCPEENPLHYHWPESRPSITQFLPCFPNKDQSTSRTCLISPQNFSSYWSDSDISNCTDIDTIQVSAGTLGSLSLSSGLFIFIFHCALKENVQKQWRRYLCCGRFRLSDNSDWSKTATNNTKKVSSENLGKSLSSSSFGSSTANWTSKAKATLNPFTKRHSNTDKCYSSPISPKSISSSPSSSEMDPNSSSSSSAILPVSQMIVKVKDYCSTRTDNFYKNIIMSDSFAHSTRF